MDFFESGSTGLFVHCTASTHVYFQAAYVKCMLSSPKESYLYLEPMWSMVIMRYFGTFKVYVMFHG